MALDLREKDVETLRSVFRRFPAVLEVRVFGSYASGNARRRSDLDLAVSAPKITISEWSDLQEALDEAPIIHILDVVRPEQITDPEFRATVERESVPIYTAEGNATS